MLYVGARSPETIELTVTRHTTDTLDLTGVTSIEAIDGTVGKLTTTSPSGAVSLWDWTISNQLAASLVLSHTFSIDGSEVGTQGVWTVCGWLTTPSTRRRLRAFKLTFVSYP